MCFKVQRTKERERSQTEHLYYNLWKVEVLFQQTILNALSSSLYSQTPCQANHVVNIILVFKSIPIFVLPASAFSLNSIFPYSDLWCIPFLHCCSFASHASAMCSGIPSLLYYQFLDLWIDPVTFLFWPRFCLPEIQSH